MNKRYFSLYTQEETADVYIYGDITSWEWLESDVSSFTLAKELQELSEEVKNINVYISSYGGEVKEGLAIYKALKRHPAKVTTHADGFACSIASVIFAAGDERLMSDVDLLMIHNAWINVGGDSESLRKQADELEKITQASINAYLDVLNIEEEELKELMNAETWLNGQEALEMGFATKLVNGKEKQAITQSVRRTLMQRFEAKSEETTEEPIIVNKPKNLLKALFNIQEEK